MEEKLLTPRADAGFTLMEVLVAMVILGIVLIGFQAAATDRMIRDLSSTDRRTIALQLAVERLRAVQLDPVYPALEARYAGSEASLAGAPGFTRATAVTRTVNGLVEYKTVTVTVQHPQLSQPVKRTLIIAAP